MTRASRLFPILSALAGLALLAPAGCRSDGDGGGGGGGDGGTGGDGAQGGTRIMDIQGPPGLSVGTVVTVEGVVVTAIDTFGGRVGSFYVQDLEGGEYSGVQVFTTDLAVASSLAVGDVVTISDAEVDEFALSGEGGDDSGRTLTELVNPEGGSMTVQKTGTAALPTPPVVDPVVLAGSDAESEKWEGVPIAFANVSVVSATRSVSMSDPTLKELRVTGPYRVGSALTELADGIALDTCYGSLTGIVDYFFDYRVLPRSAADMVVGDGCPPPENTALLCSNDLDDDQDGFTDCLDCSCILASGTDCVGPSTIVALQDPATQTVGARVTVTGAVVTAKGTTDVWIQEPGALTYGGVVAFASGSAPPASLAVGDIVTVEGSVVEFFNLTELASGCGLPATITETGVGVVPDPIVIADPATLSTPATAEPYESMLVRVNNVAVLSAPNDFGEFTVGAAAAPLTVDDTLFRTVGSLPASYASITGVLHYSFGTFKLLPRSAADLVAAP